MFLLRYHFFSSGVKVQRKKHFKRLKRIEDDESDDDGNEQEGDARDQIANELFDSGDVSFFFLV